MKTKHGTKNRTKELMGVLQLDRNPVGTRIFISLSLSHSTHTYHYTLSCCCLYSMPTCFWLNCRSSMRFVDRATRASNVWIYTCKLLLNNIFKCLAVMLSDNLSAIYIHPYVCEHILLPSIDVYVYLIQFKLVQLHSSFISIDNHWITWV